MKKLYSISIYRTSLKKQDRIGVLEICKEDDFIQFDYELKHIKRFQIETVATFGKRDYVNGEYINWKNDGYENSKEIGESILYSLNNIAKRLKFKDSYLDLSEFKKQYLHLDWLSILEEHEFLIKQKLTF